MHNTRVVASLFNLNDKNCVTLLDNRSRNRFKKLLKNWAGAKNFNSPQSGDTFVYIPLIEILNEIEETYKTFEKTPATEKIAKNVFKLIDQIKVQNDFNFEFNDDEEDDEEDE